MLEFPASDGVEVYATKNGMICFKSKGDIKYVDQEHAVYLTIGQFRTVIKHADELIGLADIHRRKNGLING